MSSSKSILRLTYHKLFLVSLTVPGVGSSIFTTPFAPVTVLMPFEADVESIVEDVVFDDHVGDALDPFAGVVERLLELEVEVDVLVFVQPGTHRKLLLGVNNNMI